jgi:tetratricopeptide (TPR) repeat protein
MPKFCTGCGSKLIDKFKFCPECGAKIISSIDEERTRLKQPTQDNQISNEHNEILICDNCGEENSFDNSICDGCGIKLKGSIRKKIPQHQNVKGKEQRLVQTDGYSKNKKNKSKEHKQKSYKQLNLNETNKKLDSKIIFMIAAVIAGILIILLISIGAFDANESIVAGNSTNSNQSTRSGIDLSSIGLINDLENQLKTDPENKELLLRLANLKNDSGFYEQAILLYKRYLAIVPSDPDARIDMAVCMYNLTDYDQAIQELKKALEYKPDHQIGYLNLGIVNLTAGNVEEAKKWFQLAVELNPSTEVGKRAKELLNSHNL